jgi:hypothetical protein
VVPKRNGDVAFAGRAFPNLDLGIGEELALGLDQAFNCDRRRRIEIVAALRVGMPPRLARNRPPLFEARGIR